MIVFPQYPAHIVNALSIFPYYTKVKKVDYRPDYLSIILTPQYQSFNDDDFDLRCTFYNKSKSIINTFRPIDQKTKDNYIVSYFSWPKERVFKIRPKVYFKPYMNKNLQNSNTIYSNSCKTISIIIPVKNQARSLSLVLQGLAQQDLPSNRYEIIIIDDGSNDNIDRILKQNKHRLNIYSHRNKISKGRAYARNIGLKHAQGDIILFIDSDCVPHPNLLNLHLLKQHQSSIAIGQRYHVEYDKAKLLIDNGFKDLDLFKCASSRTYANYDKRLDWYCLNDNLQLECFPWVFFTTCNASIPRKLAQQIEFDVNYFGWGYEDTDYGWNLYINNDIPIVTVLEAQVAHIEHPRNLKAEYITSKKNKKLLISKFLKFRQYQKNSSKLYQY